MRSNYKKITIIIFWYSLGSSPTLINLIESLAEKKFKISIFIDEASYLQSKVNFQSSNIKINIIKGIPNQKSNYNIFHQLKILLSARHFYNSIINKIESDISYMIGADTFGTIFAWLISKKKGIKYINLNLELLLYRECHTIKDKIIKTLERKAIQTASLSIIQDPQRGNFFKEDNNISIDKIVYLPVAIKSKNKIKKNNYFRKKFHIPEEKKIIIYAGEIADWSMSKELVKSAKNWDENFILILHTSRINSNIIDIVEKLKKYNIKNNIYFSTEPVEWHQLSDILSSADIGLAFYKNFGKNYSEIGSASGKIASYLEAGLPVIVSDSKSIRQIIKQHECGFVTNDLNELNILIKKIFKNYPKYHKNALMCFSEKYNIEKYICVFYEKLESLETNVK